MVIAFAISCLGLNAQDFSLGVNYGVSGYTGDLVPGSVDVLELNRSYGIQARLDLGRWFSVRSGLQHIALSGDDYNYASLIPYLDRGISFQNDVWELSALLEINLLRFGVNRTLSAACFFGGISGYSSKLQIQKDGLALDETTRVVFSDQILRVEPSNNRNSHLAFPVGFGLKIFPSAKSCLEFRTGIRLGAGDTLDGVTYEGALSGSPQEAMETLPGGFLKDNDLYFFTGLAVSIRIF